MAAEKTLEDLRNEPLEYRTPASFIRGQFIQGVQQAHRGHLPSAFTVFSSTLKGIDCLAVNQESFENEIFGTEKESFCTVLFGIVASFPKVNGRYTGDMRCVLLTEELHKYKDPQVAHTLMLRVAELETDLSSAQLQLALIPTR